MLQQTQVATALPYYERWMRRFPNVESLAQASDDEILEQWQGLGYYSRGRLLGRGARIVDETGWPDSHDAWLKLPGVGPYTSAALASILLNTPVGVVDGNVERVFARFNSSGLVGAAFRLACQKWANTIVDPISPGDWNQAMMELGATICRPRNPDCEDCPVRQGCRAHKFGTQAQFPVPAPKRETVELRVQVLVLVNDSSFGFVRVPEGKWWRGMWQFPTGIGSRSLPPVHHRVTNHKLRFDSSLEITEDAGRAERWVPFDELEKIALPAPQRKIAEHALTALGQR